MSVLGDVSAEARFYLSATALTSVEHFMDEEDLAWRRIAHQSNQSLRELAQSQRVTADSLVQDEANCRLQLLQEERRGFHEQCLVVELLRHGCEEVQEMYDAGTCALPLIHQPSPTAPDESWRNLPTMVAVDRSELNPSKYSLSVAKQQLREADGCFVDDVVDALCRSEETGRIVIAQRYHETMCRVERQYSRWFDGLRDIERNIAADYRQLVLAKLPLEERWGYVVGPLAHSENAHRCLLRLLEDATFTGALLSLDGLQKLAVVHRECVRVGGEIRRRRNEEQQTAMHARRMAVHGRQRFQTWLRWRCRCQNLRRQVEAAPLRCATADTCLVRTYCAKWRDALIVPKRLQQQRTLLEEAFMESHAMFVREGEERERNALAADETLYRHTIEEQFLSGRDQARSDQRAMELLALEARSVGAHRLLALTRWYAIVRIQQLRAKSEWLRAATERKVSQQYFCKWVLSPPTLRNTRMWRHQAGRAMWVHVQQERLSNVEEPEQRAAIALAQAAQQQRFELLRYHALLETCRIVQHQRVARLKVSNANVVRQARWGTWLAHTLTVRRSARVCQLERRNQHAHLRLRFTLLAQEVAPRCAAIAALQRSSDVAKQQVALEEGESFGRCSLNAAAEGFLVQLSAVSTRQRHRHCNTTRLDALESALGQLSAVSHGRTVGRYVAKWQLFVARAARLRQAARQGIPMMERALLVGLTVRYHAQWLGFVRRAHVQRSLAALPDREAERRVVLEDEAWALFADCEVQHHTARDNASKATVGRRLVELEAANATAVMGRYWARWGQRGLRRLRRLQCVPQVDALAKRNISLRWWAAWKRCLKASYALRCLNGIRGDAERRLLRKYYLRLAPRLLRLAKVSRAKANLERAQEAAKVLAIADVGSHRALLPGARLPPIRRADGHASNNDETATSA